MSKAIVGSCRGLGWGSSRERMEHGCASARVTSRREAYRIPGTYQVPGTWYALQLLMIRTRCQVPGAGYAFCEQYL